MDFSYLQQGLESRPCHEILYIRCTHIMFVSSVFHWGSPPPPLYMVQTIELLLFTSSIFKDTLYFLLVCVLPQVIFTLTQVVLLLITFTRVQIRHTALVTNR